MYPLNKALYGVIEDDLIDPATNRFGFLDLQRISKPRGEWVHDHGSHMDAMWYQTVMSMFWEIYCNSVFGNEW